MINLNQFFEAIEEEDEVGRGDVSKFTAPTSLKTTDYKEIIGIIVQDLEKKFGKFSYTVEEKGKSFYLHLNDIPAPFNSLFSRAYLLIRLLNRSEYNRNGNWEKIPNERGLRINIPVSLHWQVKGRQDKDSKEIGEYVMNLVTKQFKYLSNVG